MLQSKEIEWQIGLKKKKTRTYNMLPTRDSFQGKRPTQVEGEWMEKDIS